LVLTKIYNWHITIFVSTSSMCLYVYTRTSHVSHSCNRHSQQTLRLLTSEAILESSNDTLNAICLIQAVILYIIFLSNSKDIISRESGTSQIHSIFVTSNRQKLGDVASEKRLLRIYNNKRIIFYVIKSIDKYLSAHYAMIGGSTMVKQLEMGSPLATKAIMVSREVTLLPTKPTVHFIHHTIMVQNTV